MYLRRSALTAELGAALQEQSLQKDDSYDLSSYDEDLQIARTKKANLLVVGPESLVMKVVTLVLDGNPAAIIACRRGRVHLPALAAQFGTTVLRDVEALSRAEQRELLEWLNTAGQERHVVSTTSAPLFPLVGAGGFDETLYYRLNTTYIDLFE